MKSREYNKEHNEKREHLLASSLIKRIGLVLIIFLIMAVLGLYFKQPTWQLMVCHQETDEVYLSVPVQAGDQVAFKWIHSFEHIPWNEMYEIKDDGQLLLKSIAVAGFGAGIPENKGKVVVAGGMVMMSEIEEEFDSIRWIHSETALHSILLNGAILLQGKELPHYQPVSLKVRRRRYAIWQRIR